MCILSRRSKDIIISKEVLSELPADIEETSLGDRRGAKKQYRSPSNLHIREYDDKFSIHIDRVDPRKNPLGHLIKDSPETIAAAVTSLYFAKRSLEKRRFSGMPDRNFLGPGLFGLFASFITLNAVFRFLKKVLFG
jgi:hypothetical protein